jgi:hypothetical protein
LQDVFLNDNDKKNEWIELFCKIQKTYKSFNKLAFIYKYKNTKIVVNTDMGLNEINEKQKNVFCLFHQNAKYLFTANDIINIINTSLTNNYNFFSEPISVKNPYNNLPFSKSNLYNIYLFIKFSTYLRPELFFYFFNCNFNLSVFKKKHEDILRENSILNYVYKSDSETLVKEINNMIKEFNNTCRLSKLINRIFIDKEFPKERLIKIMRPYLLLFFISNYSLLYYKKVEAASYLKQLLFRFNNFNPLFGRKKIKIKIKYDKQFQKSIIGKIIEFDENHVVFKNIPKENQNFLEDHLNYSEKMYYVNNELITLDNIEHDDMEYDDDPDVFNSDDDTEIDQENYDSESDDSENETNEINEITNNYSENVDDEIDSVS